MDSFLRDIRFLSSSELIAFEVIVLGSSATLRVDVFILSGVLEEPLGCIEMQGSE